jgi:hypothetical protein
MNGHGAAWRLQWRDTYSNEDTTFLTGPIDVTPLESLESR